MSKLVYNEQILSGGIPKNQVENILGNFATEYNSTSTYAVGNYVIYDGLLYKCVTAITTAESFDSSKWVKTDCGKEFNILNNNLDKIPVYRSEVHVKEGITIPANGIVEVLFTFDKPFTELPIVAPDVRGSGTNTTTQLWKVYTDSCSVKIYNNTSVEQTDRGIRVIAMGY